LCAGRDIATADRFQVIVSMDASELATPSKRPTVKDAGPIARETARRIACDRCISTHTTANGEPIGIGRRSRLWPNAMARVIRNRDQHCQFYGCTQTHNLQIHHIKHWADGGTSCVPNGACLCQTHHTLVHEGGYSIQAVASNEKHLHQQFSMQQQVDNTTMFNVEKELRNSRESFNAVRKLLPTKYSFRVVDADGQDMSSRLLKTTENSVSHDKCDAQSGSNADLPFISKPLHPFASRYSQSTRVECA
jgi:hypothetical protein